MYIDVRRILNQVKVEDGHIILDKPLEVEKYGKRFTIRQINWWKDWEKFAGTMGMFLHFYSAVCEAATVPESKRGMKAFRDKLRFTLSNKQYGKAAQKQAFKMCKIMGFPLSFMKRKFSIDDWAEMILYIYCYNILGVKKNYKNAWVLVSKVLSK